MLIGDGGEPVVVKALAAHSGTSELVGRAIPAMRSEPRWSPMGASRSRDSPARAGAALR
ncbi:protein of unknown function (plasmid) [Azospirillum baldaniorum]|uniref:Uncharacterized protein n=1 Tax=Azospirillum baldaniorum TaxID=1064539 RepID=A0A9P1NQ76_9PROT|nr:protein of unknown function [Azospirillum baldaniorum]